MDSIVVGADSVCGADQVQLRGRGYPPFRGRSVSLSGPLVKLSADDEGVRVSVSPRWVGRIASAFAGGPRTIVESKGFEWYAQWSDIVRAEVAPRSCALFTSDGDGFRFVTISGDLLQPLYRIMQCKQIPATSVKSTWSLTFGRRR